MLLIPVRDHLGLHIEFQAIQGYKKKLSQKRLWCWRDTLLPGAGLLNLSFVWSLLGGWLAVLSPILQMVMAGHAQGQLLIVKPEAPPCPASIHKLNGVCSGFWAIIPKATIGQGLG